MPAGGWRCCRAIRRDGGARSLLVPVVGFGASAAILGSPARMEDRRHSADHAGLAVNLLWRPRKAVLQGEAS